MLAVNAKTEKQTRAKRRESDAPFVIVDCRRFLAGARLVVADGASGGGVPAVSVQLGNAALRPMSLLPGRIRSVDVVGPGRVGRHHQPRRRRRLPARPVDAAQLAGAGRRRPPGLAVQQHRRPGVARAGVVPDAGRSLRAHGVRRQRDLALHRGGRAGNRASRDDQSGGTRPVDRSRASTT